jgi:hypothetical protein
VSNEPSTAFPQSADAVVATLTELFRLQKNQAVCVVLENAKARIEETGYDGLDGGQYYFTLFLDLPLNLFAPIEGEVPRLENLIAKKLPTVLRNTGNMWLSKVVICPVLEEPKKTTGIKVSPVDVEHLWPLGMLRLFISHISVHKEAVSKLNAQFLSFGVTSFVAHEDIEPTKEWMKEIELALQSMNALVALLTPGFHESKWTDQEVGFAMGRGLLVIPVRLGVDPYGLIDKVQGAQGNLDFPAGLASKVVDLLLKHKTTAVFMRESLVLALERSESFATSRAVASKIDGLTFYSAEQLARMQVACKNNHQVINAYGVRDQIARVIDRFKPAKTEEEPF